MTITATSEEMEVQSVPFVVIVRPAVVVLVATLNVRSGPSESDEILLSAHQGQMLMVIGRQQAQDGWWRVQLPEGDKGWVSSRTTFTKLEGDADDIPVLNPDGTPAEQAAPADAESNPASGAAEPTADAVLP
jgi:hypothetical protein